MAKARSLSLAGVMLGHAAACCGACVLAAHSLAESLPPWLASVQVWPSVFVLRDLSSDTQPKSSALGPLSHPHESLLRLFQGLRDWSGIRAPPTFWGFVGT